ncbi:hypothetical protein BOVA604_4099 [Bacteroides ovatus]|jgi:hypothetical protein|uniref:hypothetical protein n=1 Tax=Bacteroides TaxID=816 RepID=UPI000E978443|nr:MULTISPECIES: hypothetical protein [Bacteroides]MCS3176116.1 hypothetical protein [Candidatus Bacteroides intestinigallinarum]RGN56378.1 hypothetical protein DXB58_19025 [Bacteroides sp. OM05-10AA]RGQ61192.1 hypothetical protein DWY87_19735 [Bacteroides sp. AF27-33]CAG9900376.1 hypothetical protein BOVA604_4099 [Bacteroides ovatus]
MKREKITISEDGIITLPSNPTKTIWMRDFDIAELFGVMLPTIKSNIRAILKSNVVAEDTTNGATLVGRNILQDYFGLDMVMALAFRINSMNAQLFRDFVIQKMISAITQSVIPLYISVGRNFVQKQSEYVN